MGGKAEFYLPQNYNMALLFIEGEMLIDAEKRVAAGNLARIANDGEKFTVEATEKPIILILSGEPLNEHIPAHGSCYG